MLDIDIYDPDVYVKGVPHDAFRRLRAEAPVYFHKETRAAASGRSPATTT